MFYEDALEPAVLTSWERVRYFLDAFGPWKGRFLARYPKRWKKLVFEGLDCAPKEKLKIVEHLNRLDDRVFARRPGAPYDESRPWLDNVLQENTRAPFHAIVAADPAGRPGVLGADDVSDAEPRWAIPHARLIRRDRGAFGDAVDLLLRVSSRIVVIDPHFRVSKHWQRDVVIEFLSRMAAQPGRIELHFGTECDPRIRDEAARRLEHQNDYAACIDDAARVLPTALSTGARLHLSAWRPRAGGGRLHNRYLITEVGGVQFGDALEHARDRAHEDHVSILDEASRARLWEDYVGASPAFDPSGPSIEYVGR